MLTWKVKRFDCNSQLIIDYDVLKYREDFIKRLKKKCADRKEFSEALRREFIWRYWSRSEHELVIEVLSKRVILIPWSGCREPMKAAIDVSDDTNFNWHDFAEYHIDKQLYKDRAKFDIWHQLLWRWDAFVDYCWYTRLPYERAHSKFNKE